MPRITVVDEAPMPSKLTSQQLAERSQYENYIKTVLRSPSKIGKLELDDSESLGNVRMRLSHAARRIGEPIEMWALEKAGPLYFRRKHTPSNN